MRNVAILGIVCLGTVGLMSGCDGESGTTGGSGGSEAASSSSSSSGMGGSSSSSSSGSTGGAGGAGGGTGGTGGSPEPPINGCDKATAEDDLAKTTVNIAVGANGFTYSPACIRVKKGTKITFTGTFSSHPTVGGLASPPTPDSASPIKYTNMGSSVTFTMDLAGTYPYYCEYHAPTMAGAIFVE